MRATIPPKRFLKSHRRSRCESRTFQPGRRTRSKTPNRCDSFPQISKDGTLLAYTSGEHIRIVQIDHLPPSMNALIENRSKAWDWSADNKRLLIGTRPAANIHTLNISSGRESLFLSKPGYSLFQAKFSPDNRAVVLVACAPTVGCRLFVAPLKSDGTPETDNWIAIDHPSRWDDKPRWSPDGNLIYFISDRDGQFCLWAQRLENRTKQPVGTPFALYHFHNSRLAMDNVGVSDSRDRRCTKQNCHGSRRVDGEYLELEAVSQAKGAVNCEASARRTYASGCSPGG